MYCFSGLRGPTGQDGWSGPVQLELVGLHGLAHTPGSVWCQLELQPRMCLSPRGRLIKCGGKMAPAARKHKPPGPRHFSSLIKYHSHCVPSATASPLAKPRVKGWEIGPTSRQTELQRTYGHLHLREWVRPWCKIQLALFSSLFSMPVSSLTSKPPTPLVFLTRPRVT